LGLSLVAVELGIGARLLLSPARPLLWPNQAEGEGFELSRQGFPHPTPYLLGYPALRVHTGVREVASENSVPGAAGVLRVELESIVAWPGLVGLAAQPVPEARAV
jgi:hypothetical protein